MTGLVTLTQANAELTLRLRQQELIGEFAMFAFRHDDLQTVLDEACRLAAHGMECSFAKVLEHQPKQGSLLVRAGVGWHPGVVGRVMLGDDLASPAGFALKTGEPIISNHLANETRFRTPALLVEHGVCRAFNVLIPGFERPYGVLEVDSSDRGDFTITDTAFLMALAMMLATAIEQKRKFRLVRENQEFVRSVLHASPDCVAVFDADGRLELMNANGMWLLEIADLGQVIGQKAETLWPVERQPAVIAAMEAARTGALGRCDGYCPGASGQPRWLEMIVAPIEPHDGAPQRFVSISRDITERVQAAETQDMLMQEVHHRVKNSLQLVQNLLSLQSRASDDKNAATQLLQSAARVRTIAAIHDRLYRTGAALLVNVGEYLTGLTDDLRAGMASTLDGRTIVIEADDVTWPAADISTLGLVVTELVTNALKYGGGEVQVCFRQPPGGSGVVTVSDAGAGLPDDFDSSRGAGLGMRLLNGLLRGEGSGLDITRDQDRTCFIARMPKPRRFIG